MRFYKRHSAHRTLLVIVTVLSLLLQVQSTFACEMMDHQSGPVKECCCDHKSTAPNPDPDQKPCCDFSLDLSFKNNPDGSAPLVLPLQLDLSPPIDIVPSYTFAWTHQDLVSSKPVWLHDYAPPNSGTDTYLTTLRLRI